MILLCEISRQRRRQKGSFTFNCICISSNIFFNFTEKMNILIMMTTYISLYVISEAPPSSSTTKFTVKVCNFAVLDRQKTDVKDEGSLILKLGCNHTLFCYFLSPLYYTIIPEKVKWRLRQSLESPHNSTEHDLTFRRGKPKYPIT